MKKLIFVLSLAFVSLVGFGQVDTLNTVGGGFAGGDSRKAAYEKINDNDLLLEDRIDSAAATIITSTAAIALRVTYADSIGTDVAGTYVTGHDNIASLATKEGVLTNSAGLLSALSDETGTGLAVFSIAPTFTTSITIGSAAINEAELEVIDGATLSTTELNYVDGVTSDIQTQIDAKLAEADTVDLATVAPLLADSNTSVTNGYITPHYLFTTPAIGTPSALVGTNISGTAASLTAGAVTGFTPASGSLTLSGADAVTVTTTASTSVTFPTSGTLATRAYGGINAQTGTTYEFVAGDVSQFVTFSNAGAITVTVPVNADVTIAVGETIDCQQVGAGAVTFAPEGGVTLNAFGADLTSAGQWASFQLIKTATDVWSVIGKF